MSDIEIKPIEPEDRPTPAGAQSQADMKTVTVRRASPTPDPRGALYAKVSLAVLERLETACFAERVDKQSVIQSALDEWLSARGF